MKSVISPEELVITPIERSETIPSNWYTDPAFHQIDREAIFTRTWQNVSHHSRLMLPGSYVSGEVAGNPILLVRGKDDILRGFYNVCRHRGGPLAIEEAGTCNALQCKYHGWTYLLDGSLRGVPKWDRVDLFDKKDYGLVQVKLDTWEGLVFMNLSSEDVSVGLKTMLGGIVERIRPHTIGTKKFYKRITYEIHCNWKVYVDNYLEGYHLPYVHPELCTLLDYQQYVTETTEHYSLQYSPFTGVENVYGAVDGEAYYYFIFPNFMLNILPGRLQTNIIHPISHNRTRVIFDYYYDDITSPEALKRIHHDIEYSDKVQQEDIDICERVQKGLESDAYTKGRFSVEMEQGVYHFQCMLRNAYRSFLEQQKMK